MNKQQRNDVSLYLKKATNEMMQNVLLETSQSNLMKRRLIWKQKRMLLSSERRLFIKMKY